MFNASKELMPQKRPNLGAAIGFPAATYNTRGFNPTSWPYPQPEEYDNEDDEEAEEEDIQE